jgi:hypothetical protein
MTRHTLTTLFLAAMAGACGDITSFADRRFEEAWQQSPSAEADILFVVDNSGSMADEQSLLAAGFNSFISEIESTGTDFHIGVVTTEFQHSDPKRGRLLGSPSVLTANDDYERLFQERVHVGIEGSGKEQGLEAASYALSSVMTTGPNAGFLRENASLLVVVVSDEDDCSDAGRLGADDDGSKCYIWSDQLIPVGNYVTDLQAQKADPTRVKVAGIVGPDTTGSVCQDETMPGKRYEQAAAMTAGMTSSICQGDWSVFMDQLGLTAAGIYTTFPLSHGAATGTLEVFVDDAPVPESDIDGYTYDATAHTITFHGIWLPARGSSVNATYTIEAGT